MSSWGAPPSTASSEASQQQAQEPSWHQQNGLGQLDLSPPRSPRARRPPPLTGSLGSVAAAAASEAAQPLPDVPEDGGLEEGDGGVERGGAEQEEESQTTFGGSWQEDAPAPFDFVPPISRAPSSVHSVHFSDLQPHEIRLISRLRMTTRDLEETPPRPKSAPERAWRWWRSWAVPGMGMFVEAWMIFSIGNIKPLLAIDLPTCFGHEEPRSCSKSAADSVTYVEISGIIVGMLALGFFADIIGRKWGSRLASSVMLLGGALLTGCAGSGSQFLAMFLAALFILGAGVGGEYPVASSSAAERAEGNKAMRKRRGEVVLLVFSMQGWGNFSNTLCILLLLAMQGATEQAPTAKQAEITWRVQFAVGTAICLALVAYRWTLLQESKVWKAERHDVAEHLQQKGIQKHHSRSEYSIVLRYYWPRLFATCLGWSCSNFALLVHHSRHEYWALCRHYWPRLLATSLAWLLNDFSFYGAKLFQSNFIQLIVSPGASNFEQMAWTLLNSAVALVGYYVAAALIDRPWYGRMRMQAIGFLMLFVLFLLCGALYTVLLDNSHAAFQLLYYLASFWNQAGPNCTTWLVAGEVYPTGVRSFFAGVSAAAGKLGALVAALVFTQVSVRTAFYASAGAGLLGFAITALFLPDTTGLDLHEIDRMNRYLLADHYRNYHGEAVNPRYLSLYERWRGYDAHYNPERDFAHKMVQRHPHLQEAAESLASLSRAASRAGSSRWGHASPSSVRLHVGPPSSVQLQPQVSKRELQPAGGSQALHGGPSKRLQAQSSGGWQPAPESP